jgi:hypothetical protein
LLLWFAGHGYTVRDEGYIVPVDAPGPKADPAFRDKAISLRRFGEYMREANFRHVLAIFDSCFSGTVFNTARSMPPPAITLATTEPVREFISSGEADQTVSDGDCRWFVVSCVQSRATQHLRLLRPVLFLGEAASLVLISLSYFYDLGQRRGSRERIGWRGWRRGRACKKIAKVLTGLSCPWIKRFSIAGITGFGMSKFTHSVAGAEHSAE